MKKLVKVTVDMKYSDPEGSIHDGDVMCTEPPNITNFLISTGSGCCCAVVCCWIVVGEDGYTLCVIL